MSESTEVWKELNCKNLVFFFTPELRAVLKGTRPCVLFGKRQRKTLRYHGILKYDWDREGARLYLSEKAKALLGV